MIISSNVFLKHLAIHKIDGQGLRISQNSVLLQDDFLKQVLVNYFFHSFKEDERYCFDQLTSNSVNDTISSIFDRPETLHEKSIELARRLFEISDSATIKPGDFFTVYFEDCVLDDEIVEVIGLFKAEQKNTFLKIYNENDVFSVDSQEGINVNKIDKGTLIFNTERENGYVVFSIDNTNKSSLAQFWNKSFLNLKPIENEYYQTKQLVHLCQDFIGEAISNEDRPGKISLFNESMDYLKSNERFNHEEFKEKVLQDPELIQSYDTFRAEQSEENNVFQQEEMPISKPAVKKSKKFIRSVIKLDKNFHVYVHGNRDDIDQGFDDNKQKSYYKLYYKEES
jgi:hypothetical protein